MVQDYNYTKPRGPVAAMFGSPGPCYGLPGLVGQPHHDPRSVHNRGPAYPFGLRHGKFSDDSSPGPAYLPTAKTYRDGKDGTPHYSLYSRPKDQASFTTPGPGAYKPENSGPNTKPTAPKYSMAARTKSRGTDTTPGPNAYGLDPMLGPKTIRSDKRQAPTYSLRGKDTHGAFFEDLSRTPGPGAYKVTEPSIYKTKPPGYSMAPRTNMVGDTSQKPGPGAHHPEMHYNAIKRSAPGYSFGIRHSQYSGPLIVDVAD